MSTLQLPLNLPGGDEAEALPIPVYQRHSRTSQEAAERIAPFCEALQFDTLEALFYAHRPLTDQELEAETGMGGSTQRPRRVKCVELRWVYLVDNEGQTKSGRRAQRWGLTDEGRRVYEAERDRRARL